MSDEERLSALEARVAKQTEALMAVGASINALAEDNIRLRQQLERIEPMAEEALDTADDASRQAWVTLMMRYCAKIELYDAIDDPDLLWAAWRGFHSMVNGPDEPCPPIDPRFLESMRWSTQATGLRHRRSPAAQSRRVNDRAEAHLEVRI